MGRTHVEEVCRELSPMRGILHWSRSRVRSPCPEEEREAETTWDELTTTPCLSLPVPL